MTGYTSTNGALTMRRWTAINLLFMITVTAHAENELPLRPPNNGGVYVIAHRGAHNDIPENSLAAYSKAIELGCDFVEIDLRTTKDGKFVSVHNGTIDAYTDGETGRVHERTLAELKAIDIGVKHGEAWKGTRIPTFEEILELCKGRCGIYLDLKHGAIDEVAAVIKTYGMEHEVVWYIAPSKVAALRKACPECIEMPDPGVESNLEPVIRRYRPRMMAPVWRNFSQTYVATCHESGIAVFVDEDDESSWENAVAWGADGIQTDSPEKLIQFLKAHPRK